MDFLRAIIGIVVAVALAIIMGKAERSKHPGVHCYVWLGSIAVLLLMWGCL